MEKVNLQININCIMLEQLNKVAEFHIAFGQKDGKWAQLISNAEYDLRHSLMKEENDEYLEACYNKSLVEIADALGNDPNLSGTLTTLIASKAPLASPTFTGTVSGIDKNMVGLSNVNNTSDANKPISTETRAAFNLVDTSFNLEDTSFN